MNVGLEEVGVPSREFSVPPLKVKSENGLVARIALNSPWF